MLFNLHLAIKEALYAFYIRIRTFSTSIICGERLCLDTVLGLGKDLRPKRAREFFNRWFCSSVVSCLACDHKVGSSILCQAKRFLSEADFIMSSKRRYASSPERLSKINLLCKQKSGRIKISTPFLFSLCSRRLWTLQSET